MNLLGIDFGKRKIGLAVSSGSMATPLVVVRYKTEGQLFLKIKKIIEEESVKKIIVGVAEGKIAEETKSFAYHLAHLTGLPVELVDESLSTKDAQRLSIEAGIKRSKRQALEDAYSATLILQKYLDNI